MAIQNKKQPTTSTVSSVVENSNPTIATVDTSTIVENIYTNEAAKTYNRVMTFVANHIIEDLSEKLATFPSDLKYGDKGGVNDTIEATLKRLGFATSTNPHAIALLDRYTRSASQLLPSRDYSPTVWEKSVFAYWRVGAFLVGHKPKVDATPKSKSGKTSLPFERLDIIASMRTIVDGDEEGNAVVSEWSTLDDDSFLEAFTMESLEPDSLVSVAIEHLKTAQAAAIAAANEARLANLKGKKLSFKITPKA